MLITKAEAGMLFQSWLRTSVFSCALCVSGCAWSVDFHLISVADIKDLTIGAGAKANSEKVKSYFSSVSKALGGQLISHDVSGSDFSCSRIKNSLAIKKVKPDDVVIFYYSGHGYRAENSPTKFPSFYCDTPVAGLPNFGLPDVVKDIRKTNARLIVAIADTCNVLVGQTPPTVAASPMLADKITKLRKLFLEKKGILLISSSKPGQFSWYSSNGGLFTSQLMRALDEATSPSSKGQWDEVLSLATSEIIVRSGDPNSLIKQNPQYDATSLVDNTVKLKSEIKNEKKKNAVLTSTQNY